MDVTIGLDSLHCKNGHNVISFGYDVDFRLVIVILLMRHEDNTEGISIRILTIVVKAIL